MRHNNTKMMKQKHRQNVQNKINLKKLKHHYKNIIQQKFKITY